MTFFFFLFRAVPQLYHRIKLPPPPAPPRLLACLSNNLKGKKKKTKQNKGDTEMMMGVSEEDG